MAERPSIVFMGTPDFAATILKRMLAANWHIGGVYTQPDSQSGRGLKVNASPVAKVALENGLPLFQPENFKNQADVEQLQALAPDFLVVASYGLLLPQNVLDLPKIAPLNIHASLLPKYRGASPIQSALLDSWQCGTTGVSLMRMVKEMDAGPVYALKEVPMAGATTESLTCSLAEAGADLLLETLPKIVAGEIAPLEQAEDCATYTKKLTKTDGRIDWRKSAVEVDAFVRAMNPWPGARTVFEFKGQKLPVQIRAGEICVEDLAPGQIWHSEAGLRVGCGTGSYRIEVVQPDGRKRLSAREFANGRRLPEGAAGVAL